MEGKPRHPKFVVFNNHIRFAMVALHSEMIPKHKELTKDMIKGGWFHANHEQKKLYLYGSSYDYKAATKEQIIEAMQRSTLMFDGYKVYISSSESLSDALALETEDMIYQKPQRNTTAQ